MIESVSDYENWRDSMHDLPRPEPHAEPDEQVTRQFSHDYPDDTSLEYTLRGDNAMLRLIFTSEDDDLGHEEMVYCGESSESMKEMVSDLRKDITAYLDYQDHDSFFQQQGIHSTGEIHSVEDYFGEFTRTALYAFEGILKDFEREMDGQLTWKAIDADKRDWLYSCRTEADAERGCVGHLRGDFGRDGTEFWTCWFDHQPQLKHAAFRDELQAVVNALREEGCLLHDFSAMRKGCNEGLAMAGSYGFRAETSRYEYCLRCTPRRGDYNFYLYCYDKSAQREHAHERSSVKDMLKAQPEKTDLPKAKKNEMER